MVHKKKPAAPAAETRAVNARGTEYKAEQLTGNRAQKGNLRSGAPCWAYEVKWSGGFKNTYEPASCLVGWEKEMKKVDEKCAIRGLLPTVSPAAEAAKAREAAAKLKAEAMQKRRARLQRLQARQERMGCEGEDEEELEGADDDVAEADEELSEEAIAAELATLEEHLQLFSPSSSGGITAAAAAPNIVGQEEQPTPSHKREGRSRVWKAFDRATDRCALPHPSDASKVCNATSGAGSGTSGHIRHLEQCHSAEWLHIKVTGERKTSTQMIDDALAAKKDQSKPALGERESNELDRLVARWVAKCGRAQAITEDKELQELVARILELCKTRYRYDLPCKMTVRRHLQLLGAEGKGIARNFLVRCLRSGVKISITGDLWSENGMGLFGIYAHGMPKFKMEKALIALIACESEVRGHPPLPLLAPLLSCPLLSSPLLSSPLSLPHLPPPSTVSSATPQSTSPIGPRRRSRTSDSRFRRCWAPTTRPTPSRPSRSSA